MPVGPINKYPNRTVTSVLPSYPIPICSERRLDELCSRTGGALAPAFERGGVLLAVAPRALCPTRQSRSGLAKHGCGTAAGSRKRHPSLLVPRSDYKAGSLLSPVVFYLSGDY